MSRYIIAHTLPGPTVRRHTRSQYFWQGHNSEIEFLKCVDDSIVPIEVKAGSATRSKSLMAFAQKYNPPLKIKVTARNLDRTNPDTHNHPLYLASKI